MKDELSRLIDAVRKEGVEKGRGEADHIVAQAKSESARIVDDARSEADRILASAQSKAQEAMNHLDQQMSLAMRDLVLEAKDELEELVALKPIRRRIDKSVADPEFMKKLILAVVSEFAKHVASGEKRELRITVPEEMKESFMKEWVVMMREDLGAHVAVHAEKGLSGFKLFREGAGGEMIVDTDSMVEVLRPLVSERFRSILDEEAKGAV